MAAVRVKASSVLEVVIAMVIILIVFGMGMMIFTNVTTMSLSAKKLEAEGLVRKTLVLTEQSGQLEDQSFQEDQFRVIVTVKASADTSLTDICVDAYDDQQQKVATAQKLVLNKQKHD